MKGATPMPAGQVVHLAELVQHAEGSIASRALVQKPVGSLTLFAFSRSPVVIDRVAADHGALPQLPGGRLLPDGNVYLTR